MDKINISGNRGHSDDDDDDDGDGDDDGDTVKLAVILLGHDMVIAKVVMSMMMVVMVMR